MKVSGRKRGSDYSLFTDVTRLLVGCRVVWWPPGEKEREMNGWEGEGTEWGNERN